MSKTLSNTESLHIPENGGRDYLSPDEANAVINAAGQLGSQRLRDQVLLRLMYRHGLRASEARYLRWTDIDLDTRDHVFYISRLRGSNDSVHMLDRDEVSGLRKLREGSTSPHVFVNERGGPISPDAIARIVAAAGVHAQIGFHVHPHMLRHSAGYALANSDTDTRLIQEFLGHRNIQHTDRYTKLSAKRLASVR
jgi:site-specific recombinase XerD